MKQIATFDLANKRAEAEVLKDNQKTIIVEVKSKKTGQLKRIKRHKIRHRVEIRIEK